MREDGNLANAAPPPLAFSVVVPTLNEEGYIGVLLACFARQTERNFEVIIVDGQSEDRTREVVEGFRDRVPGLRLTVAGERGLSHARNVGAALARSDRLIFMEADCVIEENFFEAVLQEIDKRGLGCANVLSTPLSRHWFDRLYYRVLLDWFLRLAQHVNPVITGYFIYARRSVYEKLRGFDESITFEDTDFAKRARKVTRFRVLARPRVFTSVRRLENDGRLWCLTRSIGVTLYQFLGGKVRVHSPRYPFGHHGGDSSHERVAAERLRERR